MVGGVGRAAPGDLPVPGSGLGGLSGRTRPLSPQGPVPLPGCATPALPWNSGLLLKCPELAFGGACCCARAAPCSDCSGSGGAVSVCCRGVAAVPVPVLCGMADGCRVSPIPPDVAVDASAGNASSCVAPAIALLALPGACPGMWKLCSLGGLRALPKKPVVACSATSMLDCGSMPSSAPSSALRPASSASLSPTADGERAVQARAP